jgi:hypothetical protein
METSFSAKGMADASPFASAQPTTLIERYACASAAAIGKPT